MQFQVEVLISYISSGRPFFLLVLNCGVAVCYGVMSDRFVRVSVVFLLNKKN